MKDDRLISLNAAKDYIDSQKGRPFIGCTMGEAMKIMLDEVPSAQPDVPGTNVGDMISRQAAIETVRKAKSIGQAHRMLVQLPSAQKWSGLWSEPEDSGSVYGKKLMEGDTVYLLGVEGTVAQELGAWGWRSNNYVPWEELESKIPHNNTPCFCYCDNFISFWELKWNFDDGDDGDAVPFIRHKKDSKEDKDE